MISKTGNLTCCRNEMKPKNWRKQSAALLHWSYVKHSNLHATKIPTITSFPAQTTWRQHIVYILPSLSVISPSNRRFDWWFCQRHLLGIFTRTISNWRFYIPSLQLVELNLEKKCPFLHIELKISILKCSQGLRVFVSDTRKEKKNSPYIRNLFPFVVNLF